MKIPNQIKETIFQTALIEVLTDYFEYDFEENKFTVVHQQERFLQLSFKHQIRLEFCIPFADENNKILHGRNLMKIIIQVEWDNKNKEEEFVKLFKSEIINHYNNKK